MKFTLFLLSFIFTLNTYALTFLPENDLWKEDSLTKSSNVTEVIFNRIIDIADQYYQPIAQARNEYLTINKRWSDATVNANCQRLFGFVTINMYGGLARRDEITPEGFALVLCHELGHAYGGYPFISSWNEVSAEGQADYYGAKECHAKVMQELRLEGYDYDVTPFMEDTCENTFMGENREWCMRGLIAGQSLGHLLSVIKEEPIPSYETPDTTIVDQTMTSYPATVQCRLDTYYNGVVGYDRPKCWFKD